MPTYYTFRAVHSPTNFPSIMRPKKPYFRQDTTSTKPADTPRQKSTRPGLYYLPRAPAHLTTKSHYEHRPISPHTNNITNSTNNPSRPNSQIPKHFHPAHTRRAQAPLTPNPPRTLTLNTLHNQPTPHPPPTSPNQQPLHRARKTLNEVTS